MGSPSPPSYSPNNTQSTVMSTPPILAPTSPTNVNSNSPTFNSPPHCDTPNPIDPGHTLFSSYVLQIICTMDTLSHNTDSHKENTQHMSRHYYHHNYKATTTL